MTGRGGTKLTLDAAYATQKDGYVDAGIDRSNYSADTIKTITAMDLSRINYDLIEAVLRMIADVSQIARNLLHLTIPNKPTLAFGANEGAVLVFLPGIGEIQSFYKQLMCSEFGDDDKVGVSFGYCKTHHAEYQLYSLLLVLDRALAFCVVQR